MSFRHSVIPSFFLSHRRWGVVLLLFLTAMVNNLDRQTLSVLAPTLKERLGFGAVEYSYVVTAFLAAYTLGYTFCGQVLDRTGVKRALMFALAFWSLAGMAHALAAGWLALAVCRFLLGLGESFNSPAGVKAIAEWIPRRERGLCMAVFSNGNILGAVIAPPLVSFLAVKLGWQWAFLVTGAAGLLLLAAWGRFYHAPESHPRLTEEERALILTGRTAGVPPAPRPARSPFVVPASAGLGHASACPPPAQAGIADPECATPPASFHHTSRGVVNTAPAGCGHAFHTSGSVEPCPAAAGAADAPGHICHTSESVTKPSMLGLLKNPLCAGFFLCRLLTDPITYFFAFWLPDYLQTARGFSLAMIGLVGWLPFLASDIGGPGGGALSDWLVRRGWASRRARLALMASAACLMPLAALAVRTGSPWLALGLIALLLGAQSCWMANQLTLISESVPHSRSATLLALSAIGGSVGGMASTLLAGRVIAAAGYVPVFTALGFAHLSALLVLLGAIRLNRARTDEHCSLSVER
jgi:MFS family permease